MAVHLVHWLGVILQKGQEGRKAGLAGDVGEVGEVAWQASYEVIGTI